MSKQTSLLSNQYFKTQVREAVEHLYRQWDTVSVPNRIHPYRDVACGEVLAVLITALVDRFYGPQAEQQKVAFRGCYIGMMLELAHCDGIAFDADVLEKCTTIRQWYRKYCETRPPIRTAR